MRGRVLKGRCSCMTGKPEITREQAGVAKKWHVGGLRAECFFLIQPGEPTGYCGHRVGFAGLRVRVFSYNKRTMDRAMGPF
jgi:hypothetical protein